MPSSTGPTTRSQAALAGYVMPPAQREHPSPDGRRRWTESHGNRIRGGRHCRRASSTSSFATSVRNWSAAASLSPLHWGFWPGGVQTPSAETDDFDPFWAFSENLLAHIPDTAIRILDVGCGLGANAKLLSERRKLVTAVSPIAHHCESIERAKLPGVEVRCTRFEDMSPDETYDLLLFSESAQPFPAE